VHCQNGDMNNDQSTKPLRVSNLAIVDFRTTGLFSYATKIETDYTYLQNGPYQAANYARPVNQSAVSAFGCPLRKHTQHARSKTSTPIGPKSLVQV